MGQQSLERRRKFHEQLQLQLHKKRYRTSEGAGAAKQGRRNSEVERGVGGGKNLAQRRVTGHGLHLDSRKEDELLPRNGGIRITSLVGEQDSARSSNFAGVHHVFLVQA